MKKYEVRFDFRENWNTVEDIHDDSKWIVTDDEIRRLSREWGVPMEYLMEQVEVIEEEEAQMKKFMVIEQIVGEMNRWFFQAKGEAEKKLDEVISENERQGRRRVSLCEWAAAEIEMQARQHKMFLADMEEITPDMPEWDEGDGE